MLGVRESAEPPKPVLMLQERERVRMRGRDGSRVKRLYSPVDALAIGESLCECRDGSLDALSDVRGLVEARRHAIPGGGHEGSDSERFAINGHARRLRMPILVRARLLSMGRRAFGWLGDGLGERVASVGAERVPRLNDCTQKRLRSVHLWCAAQGERRGRRGSED